MTHKARHWMVSFEAVYSKMFKRIHVLTALFLLIHCPKCYHSMTCFTIHVMIISVQLKNVMKYTIVTYLLNYFGRLIWCNFALNAKGGKPEINLNMSSFSANVKIRTYIFRSWTISYNIWLALPLKVYLQSSYR